MQTTNLPTNLAQPFCNVKPRVNTQLPLFSDSMRHHSNLPRQKIKGNYLYLYKRIRLYGVSHARRILSPGMLLKKLEQVESCLEQVVGLTPGQRKAITPLLRYWAYYGQVYVKAATVTREPRRNNGPYNLRFWPLPDQTGEDSGCSRATFWRAIRILRDLGLITVVNRIMTPFRRQISNLYQLDRLIILIAKYLSEHIAHVWPDWLLPHISTPWPELWGYLRKQGQSQLTVPLLEQ